MIPLLRQALTYYTATEVLNFLKSKIPRVGNDISNARSSGYSDEDILKFFQGKLKTDNSPRAQKEHSATEEYLSNSGLKTNAEKQAQKARFLKGALGVAGTALGVYGMYKNYTGMLSGVGRAFGFGEQPPEPRPMGGAPVEPAREGVAPVVPPPTELAQQFDPMQMLEESGIKENVDNLIRLGNTPESIKAAIGFQLNPRVRNEIQKKTGRSLDEIIDEYVSQKQAVPREEQLVEREEQPIEMEGRPEKLPPEKLGIGSTVLTPNDAIGQIKDLPGQTTKLQVGEKEKVHKTDDLIQLPIPERDLADIYTELISKMEETTGQQVSRNVYFAGYDPNVNELAYVPHTGGVYVYDDINPEDAKELTNLLTQRKTTGQNYIGAWQKGTESPIGAAMSKLILKLQKERGGKGKEYIRKFLPIYDALEPAKIAKKRKYEEEKRKKKAKKPRSR